MFVASFFTDANFDDLRETTSNAEIDAANMCLLAQGYVVALSQNPGTALDRAIALLVEEIADGYEIEPDTVRDAMNLETLTGIEFEGDQYASEVIATFWFAVGDEEGASDVIVTAALTVTNFVPVE